MNADYEDTDQYYDPAVGIVREPVDGIDAKAPSADQPARRRIVLQPVSQIKTKPVHFLWDQRIPTGEMTAAVGRAGIAKSTWATWLTAQITRGTLPGIYLGTPKPVLYFASEDSWEHTVAPRMIAANADTDLVYKVQVRTAEDRDTFLALSVDMDELERAIRESGAVLVVFDALLSTMSGTDTFKAAEVRKALEPLSQVAHDTGVSVLALAHFRKGGGSDPLQLVAGSSAFGEVIRSAIGFARDDSADDGTCVLSTIKSNVGRLDVPSLRYRVNSATVATDDGPTEVGQLEFIGETSVSVRDLMADAGSDEDRSERDGAAAWLEDFLSVETKVKSADVKKAAKVAGISERTLARARQSLGVVATSEGFPRVTFWSLPVAPVVPVMPSGATPQTVAPLAKCGTTGANSPTEPDESDHAQLRLVGREMP